MKTNITARYSGNCLKLDLIVSIIILNFEFILSNSKILIVRKRFKNKNLFVHLNSGPPKLNQPLSVQSTAKNTKQIPVTKRSIIVIMFLKFSFSVKAKSLTMYSSKNTKFIASKNSQQKQKGGSSSASSYTLLFYIDIKTRFSTVNIRIINFNAGC